MVIGFCGDYIIKEHASLMQRNVACLRKKDRFVWSDIKPPVCVRLNCKKWDKVVVRPHTHTNPFCFNVVHQILKKHHLDMIPSTSL